MNDREEQILTVLTRLRDGEPIEALDDFGILKYPVDLSTKVGDWVTASRESGCKSASTAWWFQAPRGGGKTEALRYLQRSLVDQNFETGLRKSIVVPINLLGRGGNTPADLQEEIVRRALLTKTSRLHRDVRWAADRLTKSRGISDPAAARGASVALDVAFALANLTVPAVGTLVGDGFLPWIRRKRRMRRSRIKKTLSAAGLGSPEALTLLANWIEFSMNPTRKRYDAFNYLLSEPARRGELFHLFCRTLEAAEYSSMVLLVDECDELIENEDMIAAFQALWDRPPSQDPFDHGLDIGFVMAISSDPRTLSDVQRYGGFVRRFFGPLGNRTEIVEIEKPEVQAGETQADDLARAINHFRSLLGQVTHGTRHAPGQKEVAELRARLAPLSDRRNLTWHTLWSSVANLFTVATSS